MIVSKVNAARIVPLAITRKTTLASVDANGLVTQAKDQPDTYTDKNRLVHKALGRYNAP